MLEVARLPDGFLETLGFFACFRLVHFFINNFASLPSSLASAPPRKIWVYRNISVSFIHACVAASLSVYSSFDEPSMLSDMIGAWSSVSFTLVAMSTGYFLHDFFDMLIYDASQSVNLLIHHIVVCFIFSLAVYYKMYMGLAVCSLLMEVNSVFLHFRRLMCLRGVDKNNVIYQVNGILLLITFIIFRFLTSVWVIKYCLEHRNEVPFFHFVSSAVGMAIMTGLNVDLFMSLWRADYKRHQTKQQGD